MKANLQIVLPFLSLL